MYEAQEGLAVSMFLYKRNYACKDEVTCENDE